MKLNEVYEIINADKITTMPNEVYEVTNADNIVTIPNGVYRVRSDHWQQSQMVRDSTDERRNSSIQTTVYETVL